MSNAVLAPEQVPPEQPSSSSRRPAGVPIGLALLVAGLVLWVAHFSSRSFFFWDDFLYLREAQRDGISPGYLVHAFPFNGHLSVSHRLGDWLSQTLFPLNFGFAEGVLLACFAASVWLLYRVLAELSGGGSWRASAWPWVLTLLYGTSTVPVTMVEWWGTGELRLPATALSLAAILAYLRYYRTGARRSLIWSSTALCLALLCYIKPLLVPLYLALLRVLVLGPDRSVRSACSALVREWRVWTGYLVPIALYLLAFLVWYWEPTGLPAPGVLLRYLWLSWAASFLPSFVGVYTRAGGLSQLDTGIVVLLQVLFVLMVIVSVVRDRRAWRAWTFFAVVFVVNALLVGLPLLRDLGPSIAYRLSYQMEAAYLFPIAVVAAFRPRLERASGTARGRSSPRLSAPGRRAAAVAAAAVVLIAHLAIARSGSTAVVADSPGPAARAYFHNVTSSLDRLKLAGATPTILDGTVPDAVISSYLLYGVSLPYNRYSQLFRLIEPSLAFGSRGRALYAVDPNGTLRPVSTLDTFDRPNGLRWKAVSGSWRTLDKQASVTGPTEHARLAVVAPPRSPISAGVRVARVAGQPGLVFRYRDPADYWAVVAAPYYGTWAVVKVVAGTRTVVADTGVSPMADGTTVSVGLRGDIVDVLLNARVVRTVTDRTLAGATGVGMTADGPGADQARFTDFVLVPAGG